MKIKHYVLALFCLATLAANAQNLPAPDRIKTNQGDLVVQPVTHGSLVLQWNGKTVWVDPYGGATLYTGLAKPDLILITDIHGDHLDLKTLQALPVSGAILVAPQAVVDQLPDPMKAKAVVLANGAKTTQQGLEIAAVPMYNLPETADSRHPKGRGNGYVVRLGNKNVYLSGDTEDIPEMRALKNIDVAFVCMNLPYTMDVDQAASAVLAFKPKMVYPYHYRGQNGLSDVNAFKTKVEAGKQPIEVRLRQWYPKAN
ncbi:MBL fold metallo-hydrolase [Rufibacter glacialis]|uniref:MBL fold metallo-hydrolase n=1 Tax=Rufibacter glacialis TaxID=1259555 RepID=A0A5M8Q8Z0_9BACT|nr:MBL fold metallo-hydrolase [Rufibacter glacialis]KAA6431653.1 MBL fold metallo-hydrolase [Rufibacter glacialis]GGK82673.1 metal-dependent hydrolase [Rufibacter glacialis]